MIAAQKPQINCCFSRLLAEERMEKRKHVTIDSDDEDADANYSESDEVGGHVIRPWGLLWHPRPIALQPVGILC